MTPMIYYSYDGEDPPMVRFDRSGNAIPRVSMTATFDDKFVTLEGASEIVDIEALLHKQSSAVYDRIRDNSLFCRPNGRAPNVVVSWVAREGWVATVENDYVIDVHYVGINLALKV